MFKLNALNLLRYNVIDMAFAENSVNFQTIQQAAVKDDVPFFIEKNSLILAHHLKSQDTVLHIACRYGSVKVLKYIVNKYPNYIESSNNDGKRPLHVAAQNSQEGCVQILLEHNAQIDPLKKADWTPLMLACTKQSEQIIELLLHAGADPCLRNKDGWNSFHIACREGHLPAIACLLKYASSVWQTRSNNMRSPLHTAALHGKTDTVLYLIQHCGYKPDERDSCGVTPLMDALRAGHLDAAKVLIDYHKADVSLEDKVGRQPIHLVAQSGQVPALEFIVSHGLSVNARSSGKGETPLHLAAKESHMIMALKLLETGAEIDAQDTSGRTALHYATAAQHGDMITVLHSYSAKSLKDKCGRLPENLSSREIVKDCCRTVVGQL